MKPFFKRLFSKSVQEPSSASLPAQLLRQGWKPYRFADSDVVVVLPQAMQIAFGENGVLYASSSRTKPDFTATLHTNDDFIKQRKLALKFVSNLAAKKGVQVIDVATYRYFSDPEVSVEGASEHHFWVVGIPGAAIVISLTRPAGSSFPPLLGSIRDAIPHIVGELL